MSVTNLIGTKWYFNDTINLELPEGVNGEQFYFTICEINNACDGLRHEGNTLCTYSITSRLKDAYMYYGPPDEIGHWLNSSYRTIEITGGSEEVLTNSNVITWFEENATQITDSPAQGTFVNGNNWNDTITISKPSNTKVTIDTDQKYLEKDIELTINVQSGSATVLNTNLTATPTLSLDTTTGVVTAKVNTSKTLHPTIIPGYVTVGTSGTVSLNGSNTLSLFTKSAETFIPGTSNQTIAAGKYLTGAQTIAGDSNLVADNIRNGVSIFNVTGTGMTDVLLEQDTNNVINIPKEVSEVHTLNLQAKNVTPISSAQIIAPSAGFDGLSQVNVEGDENLVAENIAEGVSIFGVSGTHSNVGIEDALITRAISGVYENSRVHNIGGYAFADCSSLTSINFPACKSIGYSAFSNCYNLTSINFPVCTTIGANVFIRCSNLTSVSFPSCTSIGGWAFYECPNLTSVNFPVCATIDDYAFYHCYNLTSINFPACTTIEGQVFSNCYNLTSINFPVCTIIGQNAFYRCSSLASINFPSCTSIGYQAFYSCSSLTSISFPACTTIAPIAFAGCSKLTSIDFPACESIGYSAFGGCYILTSINFPACESIGSYAFYSCYSLASINFPACTTIESNAFSECYRLTSISFPACTTIMSLAFRSCTRLTELDLPGSSYVTLKNTNAFISTPIDGYSAIAKKYGSIYVPASMLESYKTRTNWAYFSSRFVAIPPSGGTAI